MRNTMLTGLCIMSMGFTCMDGPPLEVVEFVNLERFMGDWFVVANIPTSMEKDAVNAVESYRMREDGNVDITFSFYKSSPGGEKKVNTAKGIIENRESNAEWKVQFFWPITFPFKVMYLSEDYRHTVIGVPSREHTWIMSRDTKIEEDIYQEIVIRLRRQGFDVDKLQRVRQEWTDPPAS